MDSNEGIGSPFLRQPSARSPKLRVYECMFLFNHGVDQVVATLRAMAKFPFVHGESLQCAQDEMEEVRAGVNADIIEELVDQERRDEGRFWKERRRYEDKLKDPDDVYLNVEQREQERKKQGLPPRVGILPRSVVAEEEERWEAEHEQKKKRARRRPKPISRPRARAR
jgi:hypothetical protein